MSFHKQTQLIFFLLLFVIILTFVSIYFGAMHPKKSVVAMKINGAFLHPPKEVNDFSLTDNNGKPFTKKSLLGHYTLMMFGFTNCGMVCPTSMLELNKMYQILQKKLPPSQLPLVVLVSVDPDRDSTAKMNSYVHTFNPHFVGVRADIKETVSLEEQLHIVAAKIISKEGDQTRYTINHTADILVFNQDGKLQAYFAYPHKAKQLAEEYSLIVNARIVK